jgi:probable rRNA maturation factor
MEKFPSFTIDVTTDDRRWSQAWRGRAAGAGQVIRAALGSQLLRPVSNGVIDLLFTANSQMHQLNLDFRGKNKPTNVLSFPNPSRPPGAIALGLETISAEASAHGKPFEDHCKHLILHGFLHLLGYDHETVTERRLMERLETSILGGMGIPNPYFFRK